MSEDDDYWEYKPMETEEQAQQEDMANSSDAQLLDHHADKKDKLMLESGYFDDQAGEGKDEDIEESSELWASIPEPQCWRNNTNMFEMI